MLSVSIVGGSGYVGGELIRLLLSHPSVKINQITSSRFKGKFIKQIHPIFRGITNLKFSSLENLVYADVIFLCLPHTESMKNIDYFLSRSKYIIDLSADFRLKSPKLFKHWYGVNHLKPDLLNDFVYGSPELYRNNMKSTKLISSAGCNATASILGLYPLVRNKLIDTSYIIIDTKVGTSEAGNKLTSGSHHPERVRSIRSYKPTNHRHVSEINQALDLNNVFMSNTSIDQVRGVLATIQVFLKEEFSDYKDKDIWKIYRNEYLNDDFIRIIKEKSGIYRYPDPKTLVASNYCDIGFEKELDSNRLVIITAIDNLMKGAAGQALQSMNIMLGYHEDLGLEFPGLYLY